MLAIIAFAGVTLTITFLIIKATIGLRVSEEEEILGLDATEHGLPSAYAGFSLMDISNTMTMEANENTDLGVSDYDKASDTQKAAAVKVVAPSVPASDTVFTRYLLSPSLRASRSLRRRSMISVLQV